MTRQALLDMGVSERAADIIERVTKRFHENPDDYQAGIRYIAEDHDATLVKIADNAHNSLPERVQALAQKWPDKPPVTRYNDARPVLYAAVRGRRPAKSWRGSTRRCLKSWTPCPATRTTPATGTSPTRPVRRGSRPERPPRAVPGTGTGGGPATAAQCRPDRRCCRVRQAPGSTGSSPASRWRRWGQVCRSIWPRPISSDCPRSPPRAANMAMNSPRHQQVLQERRVPGSLPSSRIPPRRATAPRTEVTAQQQRPADEAAGASPSCGEFRPAEPQEREDYCRRRPAPTRC